MRTNRLLLIPVIGLGTLTGFASTAGASGPESAPTVVSVAAQPATTQRLVGGPCYDGDVTVEQPAGFRISRTGNPAQPLEVTYGQRVFSTDIVRSTAPETVVIPAGQTFVDVPALPHRDVSIATASWSIVLEAGATFGEADASFSGYATGDAAYDNDPCPLVDRTESIALQVGEELHGDLAFWHVHDHRLVSGELPDGITVDPEVGVVGAPTELGSFVAQVETCPFPQIGDPICGVTTYEISVVELGAPRPPVLAPSGEDDEDWGSGTKGKRTAEDEIDSTDGELIKDDVTLDGFTADDVASVEEAPAPNGGGAGLPAAAVAGGAGAFAGAAALIVRRIRRD